MLIYQRPDSLHMNIQINAVEETNHPNNIPKDLVSSIKIKICFFGSSSPLHLDRGSFQTVYIVVSLMISFQLSSRQNFQ
jgi:hypothetical protein